MEDLQDLLARIGFRHWRRGNSSAGTIRRSKSRTQASNVVVVTMTRSLILAVAAGVVLQIASPHAQGQQSRAGLSIGGVVLDTQNRPLPGIKVLAFPAGGSITTEAGATDERASMAASGFAYTGTDGRFRIGGLTAGEYRVAAEPESFLPTLPAATSGVVYGTTFHPSTLHEREAVGVLVSPTLEPTISIVLVRVPGTRLSGSVVSASGRPTAGLRVRLYRHFGGFGQEQPVAVVEPDGTFQTPVLRPGRYLVLVERRPNSDDDRGEFAERLVEVGDRDRDGVDLVLNAGASVSGRVAVETGAAVPTAVGLRVTASGARGWDSVSTAVEKDWSFRMTGLSGRYRFYVAADRPPQVEVAGVRVNGVEAPASEPVELTGGDYDVEVRIALRTPKSIVDPTLSTAALVELFASDDNHWRQREIAEEIVKRHDRRVLSTLGRYLSHQDRRVRGNAALIFAGLGDPRGFKVITRILTDRAYRPNNGWVGGNWSLAAQIQSDRYYAAHLLGGLRDPRGVPILVRLLRDRDVCAIVPWSLAQIGDRRAVGPLMDALKDPDPPWQPFPGSGGSTRTRA